MNKLNTTHLGGMPVTQKTLEFMQAAYTDALNGIAKGMGNKVIVEGVLDQGATYSDGWVLMDGELFRFVGGVKAANIVVEETSETRLFGDGVEKQMYLTRVAKSGVTGGYPFTDFKRLNEMLVPSGLISMWSGLASAIPAGWVLCDGTNGTPNLSGRFVAGYSSGSADYGAIGNTGGTDKHTLTKAQLPNVSLKLKNGDGTDIPRDTGGGGTMVSLKGDNDNSAANGYITTEPLGSGQEFDKRPPYYVLAYIMKK